MKALISRVLCSLLLVAGAPLLSAADSKSSPNSSAASAKRTPKVDLNTADSATLQSLPGVGPSTARAIIERRPFKNVDELTAVPGIGEAKFAELRDLVTVSRAAAKKNDVASAKSRSDEKKATPTKPRSEKAPSADAPNPSRKSTASSSAPGTTRSEGKINVNTADAATLETLPGVGPTTAQSIIANRPFASVDDLARVTGIGAARLDAIRDQVSVGAQSSASKTASRKTPTASDTSGRRGSGNAERELEPTGRPTATTRTATSSPTSAARRDAPGLVNLNTASRAELEALPEIGPVKAQAIIDARPFDRIEDVMRIKGIKEGVFEQIKDKITVSR